MKKKTLLLLIVYLAVAVIYAALGLSGTFSSNVMRYMFQIFLYITIGEMWNLLSGFAGMTSLGQQAYMGLAGYSVAMVTTVYKMCYPLNSLVN